MCEMYSHVWMYTWVRMYDVCICVCNIHKWNRGIDGKLFAYVKNSGSPMMDVRAGWFHLRNGSSASDDSSLLSSAADDDDDDDDDDEDDEDDDD